MTLHNSLHISISSPTTCEPSSSPTSSSSSSASASSDESTLSKALLQHRNDTTIQVQSNTITAPSINPAAAAVQRFDTLTGIRGLCALYVFLYHYCDGNDMQPFGWLFKNGGCAVSVFFVLSGFILTHTIRQCTLKKAGCILQFYARRGTRVLPTYWLSLLVTITELSCIVSATCSYKVWIAIPSYLFAIKTWLPFFNFDWNTPVWSVQTEWFFYLIFPVVTRRLAKYFTLDTARMANYSTAQLHSTYRRIMTISAALLIIAVIPVTIVYSIFGSSAIQSSEGELLFPYWLVYTMPYTRLADFILGIMTYHMFRLFCTTVTHYKRLQQENSNNGNLQIQGSTTVQLPYWCRMIQALVARLDYYMLLLVILLVVTALPVLKPYQIPNFIRAGICGGPSALLILALAVGEYQVSNPSTVITTEEQHEHTVSPRISYTHRFLSAELMIYAGEISYAFYCLHIALRDVVTSHYSSLSDASTLPTFLFFLAAVGAAAMTYQLVEKPVASWGGKKFRKCNCSSMRQVAPV